MHTYIYMQTYITCTHALHAYIHYMKTYITCRHTLHADIQYAYTHHTLHANAYTPACVRIYARKYTHTHAY
jgi:hypothetical protein